MKNVNNNIKFNDDEDDEVVPTPTNDPPLPPKDLPPGNE